MKFDLLFITVINDRFGAGAAQVAVNDGARSTINQICSLVAAVLLHQRDLKLEVFAFLLVSRTASLFDSLQVADVAVVAPTDGFSAAQLPMQLELVRLDVFTALRVVAVKPDVDHLAWIVNVLNELNFAFGL